MITLPIGFDFNLLISDLLTLGIPIVSIAVAIFVYSIISQALQIDDK